MIPRFVADSSSCADFVFVPINMNMNIYIYIYIYIYISEAHRVVQQPHGGGHHVAPREGGGGEGPPGLRRGAAQAAEGREPHLGALAPIQSNH